MKNIGTTSPLKVALHKVGLYPPRKTYNEMRYYLCKPGHEQELAAILKKYPDAVRWEKEGDMQPIAYAIWQRQLGSAEVLIKCDPTIMNDKHYSGCSVVHEAVSRGKVEVFNMLKSLGADMLQKDGDGNTLLHVVARARFHPEMIPLLLAEGVDPKARNDKGQSPLMLTAQNGGGSIFDEFYKLDPDIMQTDNDGNTMLMAAAGTRDGDAATIEKLVKMGADFEVKRKDGSSALDIALGHYNACSAMALIEAGAKVDFDSPQLKTCMDLFRECGDIGFDRLIAEKKEETAEEELTRKMREKLEQRRRVAAEKQRRTDNAVASCTEGTPKPVTVKKPLQLKAKS